MSPAWEWPGIRRYDYDYGVWDSGYKWGARATMRGSDEELLRQFPVHKAARCVERGNYYLGHRGEVVGHDFDGRRVQVRYHHLGGSHVWFKPEQLETDFDGTPLLTPVGGTPKSRLAARFRPGDRVFMRHSQPFVPDRTEGVVQGPGLGGTVLVLFIGDAHPRAAHPWNLETTAERDERLAMEAREAWERRRRETKAKYPVGSSWVVREGAPGWKKQWGWAGTVVGYDPSAAGIVRMTLLGKEERIATSSLESVEEYDARIRKRDEEALEKLKRDFPVGCTVRIPGGHVQQVTRHGNDGVYVTGYLDGPWRADQLARGRMELCFVEDGGA